MKEALALPGGTSQMRHREGDFRPEVDKYTFIRK